MNLRIITNLGRELSMNIDSLPTQNRAGIGVKIGLRTSPKMKKDECIMEIKEEETV